MADVFDSLVNRLLVDTEFDRDGPRFLGLDLPLGFGHFVQSLLQEQTVLAIETLDLLKN